MHSFKFKNNQDNEYSMEEVIGYRRRKVFRQQVLYIVIFVIIIIVALAYAYEKIAYKEFDGYMSTDMRYERAFDDIFVKEVYVRVSDFVVPGDTIFSYIYLQPILDQVNQNEVPQVVIQSRNFSLQMQALMSQAQVLRTKIAELQKQIEREKHNVSFGLSSSSHYLDLQRQLQETKSELAAKQREIAIAQREKRQIDLDRRNSTYDAGRLPELQDILLDERYNSLVYYRIAADSCIVSSVEIPDGSLMLKGETIFQGIPLDAEKENAHIVAYVPQDDVREAARNDYVDVILNDEITIKARFALVGMRVEELPDNLKSNFSTNDKAVLVQLKIQPGQKIPQWAMGNNLPVKVRAKRIFNNKNDVKIWNIVGEGLTEDSKNFLDTMRQKTRQRNQNIKQRHAH